MKIGKHIAIVYYGNFPFGGASANLLRYFSLALSEKWKVEVLLPNGCSFDNKNDVSIKRSDFYEGVHYKKLGFIVHPKKIIGKILNLLISPFLIIYHLFKLFFQKKIDILITYNAYFLQTIILIFLKKLFRKPLVIILPEFYERPTQNSHTGSTINWYSFYFSMKYLIKYADKYIVASYFLKKYIEEELKIDKEVFVMPNLIDSNIFNLKNIKPYKEELITIGYTGIPVRKDGIFDLINSFSLLNKNFPKTHLLIIGDLMNGKTILPSLKEYATKKGILDKITFTGLVSSNEIPNLLNSCQILTLTRPNGVFAEAGFPTKLGEYFACKKPVVITSVGDIPRYFKDEEHVILVTPENPESISIGFEKLIKDKNLAEKISINGYLWMQENLNYKMISKKLERFLN
jgi:glycosyltransferase involved in cell wall biosynthesis